MPTEPKVFISYRREDSAASAGRVFDRLRERFGRDNVFRDIDTLAPGAEFAKVIRERIGACDALVVLIGKDWATLTDAGGRRRLDDPNDYVTAEIREALERNKLVIPALIEGARMPGMGDVAGSIGALAGRNAIEINESRFDYDCGKLIEAIEGMTRVPGASPAAQRSTEGSGLAGLWRFASSPDVQRTLAFIGSGLAALVVAGWTIYTYKFAKPEPPVRVPESRQVSVSANQGGIAAAGNVTATAAAGGTAVVATGPVTIGITLEQYEAGLKRREQEIRAELAKVGPADSPARLKKELADVEAKSQHLEKSLADYKAKLAEASEALEKLKRDVPLDELKQAKSALVSGDTAAAETLFSKSLSGGKERAAESAYQLGELAYGRVDYRKAYESYIEATRLEPDNPKYLDMAGQIALDSGRYPEAQTYWERAVAIRRKSGPSNAQSNVQSSARDLATSLNNLAVLYKAEGLYKKAEPLYREALALRVKSLGAKHPDVAVSLNNLAALYKIQGDFTKAQPLYEQSLAINRAALAPEHPNIALTLNNLAALYQAEGLSDKAEPLYQEALAIRRKSLGNDHPDVAGSLVNLASLYQSQRLYSKSEPLYREALAIQKKALGPDHPTLATTLNNLSEMYRSQGQYAKAEPLYRQALEIQKKSLGSDHPAVAMTLHNLALLYKAEGQCAKAEPLHRRALEILQQKLEPDDPNLATVMANYAACLVQLGRDSEARGWQARADAIRRNRAAAAR